MNMKWYFTWNRPKMKAAGGAFWPVMAIRYVDKHGLPLPPQYIKDTIRHEEGHMFDQLLLLLVFFYLLYLIFWIFYGYQKNPFEVYARVVAITDEWTPFGWWKYI